MLQPNVCPEILGLDFALSNVHGDGPAQALLGHLYAFDLRYITLFAVLDISMVLYKVDHGMLIVHPTSYVISSQPLDRLQSLGVCHSYHGL